MAALPNEQQKTRVLLIHNNDGILESQRTLLEKQGFRVELARNGSEGIEKAYRLRPEVIISAIMMEEVNGYQVCRLLKNDPVTQTIPFILISDFQGKMDKFWGIKAGADLFLSTDELETRLVKQIRMLLEIYEHVGSETPVLPVPESLNIAARLNQILDKALIESSLMIEFRNLSDLIHDANLLNHMFFSLLESLIEYDAAAIFYNDANKLPRQVVFHAPDSMPLSTAQAEEMKTTFFNGLREHLSGSAIESAEFDIIGNAADEAPAIAFKTVYQQVIQHNDRMIGVIAFYAKDAVDYSRIFPMPLVLDEVDMLMRLRNLYSQAEILAVTDRVTGLFNYKHFREMLEREFKSARRYELAVSIAILDIAQFKALNEAKGHACGDEVLQHVATLADKHFRSVDIVARYGAGQLAVLFPKTPMENAKIATDRLEQLVQEFPLQWNGETLPISIQVGLASMSPEVDSASALLLAAEEELRAVKPEK